MYKWLNTATITTEEQEILLDEWLEIICNFTYERDLKNTSESAENKKKRREATIIFMKKLALKNNTEFNRKEFKYITLA